ncbi:MAG: CoA transferase, partial [Acidimicrobiales bacterium]
MTAPLDGVRVLEVASHVFVPMAGAVLSEWGAQVIKVEHPETGDPYRGLATLGLHNVHDGVDPFFQSANRGKRSVGIDLKHDEGRRLLSRLVEQTDVFLTNLRPDARRRLQIDVADIRRGNPAVIYVRGTAFGARGPDAGRGGYDSGAYWARSGM